jgi:hypothetical protein
MTAGFSGLNRLGFGKKQNLKGLLWQLYHQAWQKQLKQPRHLFAVPAFK